MNTQQQISTIREIINNNKDGFTLKYTTLKPTDKKGFVVSITNIKGKQINRLIKKVLFIATGFKQIKKNLYIGGWFFEGCFYLDLSLIINNKENSLYVGGLFNQLSIFDLNKLEEIKLKN